MSVRRGAGLFSPRPVVDKSPRDVDVSLFIQLGKRVEP